MHPQWLPCQDERERFYNSTKSMRLLAEIYRRRYDEFSHILRVYRVAAAETR